MRGCYVTLVVLLLVLFRGAGLPMTYITGIVCCQPAALYRVAVRIDAPCWDRARLRASMREELANFSTLPDIPHVNKTESVSVINL